MNNWTKARSALHAVAYPREQRDERNRLAQARYRAKHAKRDAKVRVVVNILRRQSSYHGDLEQLAAALRALLGGQFSRALATELRRQPSPPSRTRRKPP